MSQKAPMSSVVARTTDQATDRGEETSHLSALVGAVSGGGLVANEFGLASIAVVGASGCALLLLAGLFRRSGGFPKSLHGIGTVQLVMAGLAAAWTFGRPLIA